MPHRLAGLSVDIAIALLSFSIAVLIGLRATAAGPGVGPDAVTYINMGANIHRGLGAVSNLAGVTNPEPFTPITVWPPGYPLLIAGVMYFGVSPTEAARIVVVLAFGLLAVATYWLGVAVSGRTIGTLAALICVTVTAVVSQASYAHSEMPFMAFSTLVVFSMVKIVTATGKRRWCWLLVCSLVSSLAVLTRYIGGVWVLIGVGLIIEHRRTAGRQAMLMAGCYGVLSLTPLVPWLLRNRTFTGHITGIDRISTAHPPLAKNLETLFGVLADDITPPLNLGIRRFLALIDPGQAVLLLAILCAAVIGLLWRAQVRQRALMHLSVGLQGRSTPTLHFPLYLIPAIYALVYQIALFVASSVSLFPEYDWPRYLAPLYPLIFVSALTVFSSLLGPLLMHWPSWVRMLTMIAVPLLYMGANATQTAGFVEVASRGQGYSSPDWRSNAGIVYLARRLTDQDVVYSDRADAVSYLLNHPARYLPHRESAEEIDAFLFDRPDKACEYIIVFKDPWHVKDAFFAERLTSEDLIILVRRGLNLILLADFEDSVIYEIGEASNE